MIKTGWSCRFHDLHKMKVKTCMLAWITWRLVEKNYYDIPTKRHDVGAGEWSTYTRKRRTSTCGPTCLRRVGLCRPTSIAKVWLMVYIFTKAVLWRPYSQIGLMTFQTYLFVTPLLAYFRPANGVPAPQSRTGQWHSPRSTASLLTK